MTVGKSGKVIITWETDMKKPTGRAPTKVAKKSQKTGSAKRSKEEALSEAELEGVSGGVAVKVEVAVGTVGRGVPRGMLSMGNTGGTSTASQG